MSDQEEANSFRNCRANYIQLISQRPAELLSRLKSKRPRSDFSRELLTKEFREFMKMFEAVAGDLSVDDPISFNAHIAKELIKFKTEGAEFLPETPAPRKLFIATLGGDPIEETISVDEVLTKSRAIDAIIDSGVDERQHIPAEEYDAALAQHGYKIVPCTLTFGP